MKVVWTVNFVGAPNERNSSRQTVAILAKEELPSDALVSKEQISFCRKEISCRISSLGDDDLHSDFRVHQSRLLMGFTALERNYSRPVICP